MRFNRMSVLTLWIALAVSIGANVSDSANATGQWVESYLLSIASQ